MEHLIDSQVDRMVQDSVLCWLATTSADGQPNVSPKEVFAHFERWLLIANIASPQSVQNVKANGRVCVAFVNVFVQKGFQLKGACLLVEPGDPDFERFHKPLLEIAGPDYPILSIFRIEVDQVKPIIAPRYNLFPDTTEQEQIAAAMANYGVQPVQAD